MTSKFQNWHWPRTHGENTEMPCCILNHGYFIFQTSFCFHCRSLWLLFFFSSLSIYFSVHFSHHWRSKLLPGSSVSSSSYSIEFLGKTITDHNPIFFRNKSIKRGSQSGAFFQESTKKGFYLLWLSFLIHNLSPDHAKNDPDHAENDPKLPNLSKFCGFLEKRSGSWSSFYTCISEKNRIVIRIVLAWSGLKLWIKNDNHRR